MSKRVAVAALSSVLAALVSAEVLGAVAQSAPLPAGRPDLEVISVAADHTELAPATTFTLTFVVKSHAAATGPFSVGVYYAKGPADPRGVPRDAQLLSRYPVDRGLAKDDASSFSTEIRLPACEDCGKSAVYVVADPSNRTAESSESNNVRSVTLDVAPDHVPDLLVEKVSVSPDRGSTSDTVSVRATVRNASRFVAHGPFRVSVYCSSDAEVTASDRRL